MAQVTTYLNFDGTTEEAFAFYKDVFGTDYLMPPMRMSDMPPQEGAPTLAEDEARRIMHIALPILAGHVLMATDILPSMGHTLVAGNNVTINLSPDTREETERLYAALSAGGSDQMPLQDMFWGAYFGTCVDRFGTRWMFNGPAAE